MKVTATIEAKFKIMWLLFLPHLPDFVAEGWPVTSIWQPVVTLQVPCLFSRVYGLGVICGCGCHGWYADCWCQGAVGICYRKFGRPSLKLSCYLGSMLAFSS